MLRPGVRCQGSSVLGRRGGRQDGLPRTGVVPPRVAKFEEVERYLLMDWQAAEARKLIETELDTVKKSYDIVVDRE